MQVEKRTAFQLLLKMGGISLRMLTTYRSVVQGFQKIERFFVKMLLGIGEINTIPRKNNPISKKHSEKSIFPK